MFVRVRDPETGHEFDLPEEHRLLTSGLVTRVKPKQYPPSDRPRRAKYYTDLAGQSATRPQAAPHGAVVEATYKEN